MREHYDTLGIYAAIELARRDVGMERKGGEETKGCQDTLADKQLLKNAPKA